MISNSIVIYAFRKLLKLLMIMALFSFRSWGAKRIHDVAKESNMNRGMKSTKRVYKLKHFRRVIKKDKLGNTIQQMGPLNHCTKQKMSASS